MLDVHTFDTETNHNETEHVQAATTVDQVYFCHALCALGNMDDDTVSQESKRPSRCGAKLGRYSVASCAECDGIVIASPRGSCRTSVPNVV